jgi:hypothetical protein
VPQLFVLKSIPKENREVYHGFPANQKISIGGVIVHKINYYRAEKSYE